MYTHVCVETAHKNTEKHLVVIKKGDFCTHIKTIKSDRINGDVGYVFEEHPEYTYSARLFVPLPPPKTVYVAVSEEIKEEIPELILN